jgi:hypothetical protein
MSEAAIQVPMDNAAAGPIDMFYFFAADLKWMRSRRHSPGENG